MSKLEEMLSRASRNTIAELFAMDPFKHTKHDIDCIIEYYAERRKEYVMSGKTTPRVDKPKASLDELGLL